MRQLIVTRPAAQAAAWVEALRALGQPAQALPLISIAAVADLAPLQHAWQRLSDFTLVMFVSANAVNQFFAAAPASLPARAAWPPQTLAGSTGPGTSAALLGAGVPAAALVEPAGDAAAFDSEALWSQLAARDWDGRRVLVVRGEQGREWLADRLREHGAEVDFVAAYQRQAPAPGAAQEQLLQDAQQRPWAYLWHFSSSEAIAQLCALRPAADWSRSAALASHPRIAQAARAAGFGDVEQAPPFPRAVAECAARMDRLAAALDGAAPLQVQDGSPMPGPTLQSSAP